MPRSPPGYRGRHYPHRRRPTHATELVRAGVDIHVVQQLLGHRHITSTVGYTHLVLDDLREAVAGVWEPSSTGAAGARAPSSGVRPRPDLGATDPAPWLRPPFTT